MKLFTYTEITNLILKCNKESFTFQEAFMQSSKPSKLNIHCRKVAKYILFFLLAVLVDVIAVLCYLLA